MDAEWAPPGGTVGPALMGLLLGLDMMRRIDPSAVSDRTAVEALRGVVLGYRRETTAAGEPKRERR